MNDVPEGGQLEPRLPEDDEYWDGLAVRIVDAAEPILRRHRDAQAWWQPLARWSPAIAVAAAAASLLLMVAIPSDPERLPTVAFGQLLSPQDPIAQAVVAGAPVTDISAMLLVESGGER